MATKRQLAAIMFTDITGFSAMMEADEDYARKIRDRHRKIFRDSHETHHGRILQYYGDGTLSIFESAAAAVECAVEMQIEFRKEPEVPLRIGIHTGDISYDDEGAYGDGLNIAARIERLCIPGGVFISAKVYDDIKNHKWLTAVSLGQFSLRNIYREIQIYAITCKGLDYPSEQQVRAYPEHIDANAATQQRDIVPRGRRRKGVAFLLALLLGVWGIHRFYLGQKLWGIIHFIVAFVALMLTIEMNWFYFPPIAAVGIVAFLDAILLLVMPKAEFDYKYNRAAGAQTRPYQRVQRKHYVLDKTSRRSLKNPALINGIREYKRDRYHDAIEAFQRALEIDENSTAAHFNLACCYSVLRDPDDAYYHLAKAVELGFNDFDRIQNHEAFTFLRSRDDFKTFVQNRYRVVEQLPAAPATGDLLE
ncbi:MAG: NINE protein, partial [Saprospiraceae bacterium]|nr:NINE protein [Saprospiraceae bacterium]